MRGTFLIEGTVHNCERHVVLIDNGLDLQFGKGVEAEKLVDHGEVYTFRGDIKVGAIVAGRSLVRFLIDDYAKKKQLPFVPSSTGKGMPPA